MSPFYVPCGSLANFDCNLAADIDDDREPLVVDWDDLERRRWSAAAAH